MAWGRIGVLVAVLGVAVTVAAATDAERVEALREGATVTLEESLVIASPAAVVEALLADPVLAGEVWRGFECTPAYEISAGEGGAFHLVDPTGIVAEVRLVATHGRRRIYLADGRIDHWAVKGLSEATAVLEVEVVEGEGGSTIRVAVAVKAGKWVADVALKVLAPAIDARVKARVAANLADAKKIAEAIARRPKAVARRLEGEPRQAFQRAFVPPAPAAEEADPGPTPTAEEVEPGPTPTGSAQPPAAATPTPTEPPEGSVSGGG